MIQIALLIEMIILAMILVYDNFNEINDNKRKKIKLILDREMDK